MRPRDDSLDFTEEMMKTVAADNDVITVTMRQEMTEKQVRTACYK